MNEMSSTVGGWRVPRTSTRRPAVENDCTDSVGGSGASVAPGSLPPSTGCSAAGDPRVRFRGPFAEGSQDAVLDSIDVLVLPSVWWENSPLVVLEAQGRGVPVIASAIGGVPELVTGDSGLLVPPGDRVQLRDALRSVRDGVRLAGALAPLPLQTVAEHAAELEGVYAGA